MEGCESKNHTECDMTGFLWKCSECGKSICTNEGMPGDDYYELCDDCWAIATNNESIEEPNSSSSI